MGNNKHNHSVRTHQNNTAIGTYPALYKLCKMCVQLITHMGTCHMPKNMPKEQHGWGQLCVVRGLCGSQRNIGLHSAHKTQNLYKKHLETGTNGYRSLGL